MRTDIQRTVLRCFAVLNQRQLRQIRHSVPTDTFQTLVVSFVLTSLDYSNSALAGLLLYLVRRLQSVLNAAARLIYHLWRSDHISDALACLHWLCVPERIEFMIDRRSLKSYIHTNIHININSCHSPTKFLQPANLTIPTQFYLCSVYR